jgi:hypothetical protein
MNSRAFLLSTLIAGSAMGLLGNLPLLNLINCCLCLWIWLGGALAVILYRRFNPEGVGATAGQAVLLGIVAGLIAAVVGALVFLVTAPISMPLFNSLARSLQIQGDLPLQSNSFGDVLGASVIFFVIDVVLYSLFGALGAMIAASLTKQPAA